MMKRILAVFLTAVILLGILPGKTLAAQLPLIIEITEETTETTAETTEAIPEASASAEQLPEVTEAAPESGEEAADSEQEPSESTEETAGETEELPEQTQEAEDVSAEVIFRVTGDYLTARGTPIVGSIGGEWTVIGLARSGRAVPEGYYQNVVTYVQSQINPDTSRLNKNKSTENSRIILALTALGYDVTNVGGYDLLAGLNQMSYLRRQGINGPIWALIAFDSHAYAIPEGDVTREALVRYILSQQFSDGGWALDGNTADPDMTGMALQALAPYYAENEDVRNAVDRAVAFLSNAQLADGGYASTGAVNSEAISQTIVALTALGIDPDSDPRFVKNGKSAIDALCTYAVEGGGFAHIPGQGIDGMATEQGYYALTAWFRFLEDKTALYDMSDVTIRQEEEALRYSIVSGGNSTWVSGDGPLTIVSDGPLSEFEGVTLNATPVDSGSYTLGETETSVTFAPAYLDTLPSGIYVVTLMFTQRQAATSLTIVDAEDSAAAVAEVEALIDAIGTVTKQSEEKIKAAREAYDALTENQKKLVKNYDVLLKAEKEWEDLAGKIFVTFSILGDRVHDSDTDGSVHTLAGGGLSTWAAAKKYTVKAGSTVKTVLDLVLAQNGMSCSNPTGNYVESITKGGVTIGEFTNGRNSGWMYTLNGYHPNLGVAQQTLKDGDVVVFHYTDDYTLESGSWDPDKKAAQRVEGLINQIAFPITPDSEAAIKAARQAYDALTAKQKSLVSNLDKLEKAEYELALLQASREDKEAAQKVIDMIAALGQITPASQEAVEDARAAYEKLTDLQKRLVTNLEVLEAAERTLAALLRAPWREIYEETGNYLENLGTPTVASIGGEWMVIGLTRSGREVPEGYYDNVLQFVAQNIDENQRLHRAKSTENARLILALTAIGGDVTDVGGHNLLTGLNDMAYVQKQGINGPIWALIALDSGNYPAPEGGNVSREALLQVILDAQLPDGGWTLSGGVADPDMTGMALQALAPYAGEAAVKTAVEAGIAALSDMQKEDGSYASIDGASSESIAQVIVALTALGIDPDTDPRFAKNGISALSALLSYAVEGGGFRHILEGGLDGMATEQSYYALTAYARFLAGKTPLYDMTDVMDLGGDGTEETEPLPEAAEPETKKPGGYPLWCVIASFLAGVAVGLLIPILKKKFMLL